MVLKYFKFIHHHYQNHYLILYQYNSQILSFPVHTCILLKMFEDNTIHLSNLIIESNIIDRHLQGSFSFGLFLLQKFVIIMSAYVLTCALFAFYLCKSYLYPLIQYFYSIFLYIL